MGKRRHTGSPLPPPPHTHMPTLCISSTLSSRATTTRSTPRRCTKSAPSGLVMVIWVDPWMGKWGATWRMSSTTPKSYSEAWRTRGGALHDVVNGKKHSSAEPDALKT